MKTYNLFLLREFFTLIISIILFVYALLNIRISPPPNNLEDIPNQYGKTFCIPIKKIDNNSGILQFENDSKSKMMNAYILVVLVLVFSVILFIFSIISILNHFNVRKYMSSQIKRVQLR